MVAMLPTYWSGSLEQTVIVLMVFVLLQIAIAGVQTSPDPMIHYKDIYIDDVHCNSYETVRRRIDQQFTT